MHPLWMSSSVRRMKYWYNTDSIAEMQQMTAISQITRHYNFVNSIPLLITWWNVPEITRAIVWFIFLMCTIYNQKRRNPRTQNQHLFFYSMVLALIHNFGVAINKDSDLLLFCLWNKTKNKQNDTPPILANPHSILICARRRFNSIRVHRLILFCTCIRMNWFVRKDLALMQFATETFLYFKYGKSMSYFHFHRAVYCFAFWRVIISVFNTFYLCTLKLLYILQRCSPVCKSHEMKDATFHFGSGVESSRNSYLFGTLVSLLCIAILLLIRAKINCNFFCFHFGKHTQSEIIVSFFVFFEILLGFFFTLSHTHTQHWCHLRQHRISIAFIVAYSSLCSAP